MTRRTKLWLPILLAVLMFATVVVAACTQTATVSYDKGAADATGTAPQTKTVTIGDTITLPNNPFTREGYEFNGWSDGSKTYAAGDKYTVEGDVTFTAQWKETKVEPVTYALSYALGTHAANATAPAGGNYEAGATVTLAAAPEAAEGYEFAGWNDGSKTYDAGASFVMPAQNVTMTAQWKSVGGNEPVKYALSYNLGDYAAEGATAPAAAEYEAGAKVTLAAAPEAAAGYEFAGWSDGNNVYDAGAEFTMPGNAVTMTAQWNSIDEDDSIEWGAEADSDGGWNYWTNVDIITVDEVKFIDRNNGINIHAAFSSTGELGWGFQLFYNDTEAYELGTRYVLKLTVTSKTDCTVTFNDKPYQLKADEATEVEVEFTYSFDGDYTGMSMMDMQVAVVAGASYDLTLTNITWEEASLEGQFVFGEEDVAVGNPGNMYYWNNKGWVGQNNYVDVTKHTVENGVYTFEFSGTSATDCWFGAQLFYKNSANVIGNKYTVSFVLNSSVAGSITVNGQVVELQVGDNNVSVTYTEPNTNENGRAASLSIQFGVANPASVVEGTFVLSELAFSEASESAGPTENDWMVAGWYDNSNHWDATRDTWDGVFSAKDAYTLTMSFVAGDAIKFKQNNGWNDEIGFYDTDRYSLTAAESVTGDIAKLILGGTGSNNGNFEIKYACTLQFTFNPDTKTVAILVLSATGLPEKSEGQPDEQYVLVGSWGGGDGSWSDTSGTMLTWNSEIGAYQVTFTFAAKDQWKIKLWGDDAWAWTIDSNCSRTVTFANGIDPYESLFTRAESNIKVEYDCTVTITLNIKSKSVDILVTSLNIVEREREVYLRGDMNNWSDSAEYKFVDNGDGTFTLGNVTISSSQKFKIVFDGAWFGTNELTIICGDGISYSGNGDIYLTAPGAVDLVFNPGKETLTITTVHAHSYDKGLYQINNDGTHSRLCDGCDEVENVKTEHDFSTGDIFNTCICGYEKNEFILTTEDGEEYTLRDQENGFFSRRIVFANPTSFTLTKNVGDGIALQIADYELVIDFEKGCDVYENLFTMGDNNNVIVKYASVVIITLAPGTNGSNIQIRFDVYSVDTQEHVHSYNEGKYQDNNDGTHSRICDDCDEVEDAKTAHVFGDWTPYDGVFSSRAEHIHECVCGYSEREAHDYESGDAFNTCKCGYEKDEYILTANDQEYTLNDEGDGQFVGYGIELAASSSFTVKKNVGNGVEVQLGDLKLYVDFYGCDEIEGLFALGENNDILVKYACVVNINVDLNQLELSIEVTSVTKPIEVLNIELTKTDFYADGFVKLFMDLKDLQYLEDNAAYVEVNGQRYKNWDPKGFVMEHNYAVNVNITSGEDKYVFDWYNANDQLIATCTYVKEVVPTEETITVHFHRPEGWNTAFAYIFENGSSTQPAWEGVYGWPGQTMIDEGDGWYKAEFTLPVGTIASGNLGVIVNNKVGDDGVQSGDIIATSAEVWISSRYLRAYDNKEDALAEEEINVPGSDLWMIVGSWGTPDDHWDKSRVTWDWIFHEGNNYTITMEFVAGNSFKLKQNDDGWDNQMRYGESSRWTIDKVEGVQGAAIRLLSSEGDGNFHVDYDCKLQFTFNPDTKTVAILILAATNLPDIDPDEPAEQYYLAGNFGGKDYWGDYEDYKFIWNSDVEAYQITMTFGAADQWKIKLKNSWDWALGNNIISKLNVTYAEGLPQPSGLFVTAETNVKVEYACTATITLKPDATTATNSQVSIYISAITVVERQKDTYLAGDMTNWQTNQVLMTNNGDGTYTLKNVEIKSGQGFKIIYDGTWMGTQNLTIKVTGAAYSGTDNIYLNTPGKYDLTFDSKTNTLTITVVVEEGCQHSYDKGEYKNNGDGTHSRICDICGEAEKATQHDLVYTPHEEGIVYDHTITCSKCDYEAVGEHNIETAEFIDFPYHKGLCSDCGQTVLQLHDSEGACSICGYKYYNVQEIGVAGDIFEGDGALDNTGDGIFAVSLVITKAGKLTLSIDGAALDFNDFDFNVYENNKLVNEDWFTIENNSIVVKYACSISLTVDLCDKAVSIDVESLSIPSEPVNVALTLDSIYGGNNEYFFFWGTPESEIDLKAAARFTVNEIEISDRDIALAGDGRYSIKFNAGDTTLAKYTLKWFDADNNLIAIGVFEQESKPDHKCEDECEECGGCKTDCQEPECSNKCDCSEDPDPQPEVAEVSLSFVVAYGAPDYFHFNAVLQSDSLNVEQLQAATLFVKGVQKWQEISGIDGKNFTFKVQVGDTTLGEYTFEWRVDGKTIAKATYTQNSGGGEDPDPQPEVAEVSLSFVVAYGAPDYFHFNAVLQSDSLKVEQLQAATLFVKGVQKWQEISGINGKNFTFKVQVGDTTLGEYTFEWRVDGKTIAKATYTQQVTEPDHKCEDECEVCGGCKTDCQEPECSKKCDCSEEVEGTVTKIYNANFAGGVLYVWFETQNFEQDAFVELVKLIINEQTIYAKFDIASGVPGQYQLKFEGIVEAVAAQAGTYAIKFTLGDKEIELAVTEGLFNPEHKPNDGYIYTLSRTADNKLELTVEKEPHTHVFNNAPVYDAGQETHTYTCSDPDCDQSEGYTKTEDCTKTGTCSCGHVYVPANEWIIVGDTNDTSWKTPNTDSAFIFVYNHETGTYSLQFTFKSMDAWKVKTNISNWADELAGNAISEVTYANGISAVDGLFSGEGNIVVKFDCTVIITLDATLTSMSIHVLDVTVVDDVTEYSYTFHVYNSAGWANVYLYAWADASAPGNLATGGWPGTLMEADTDMGDGWYKLTLTSFTDLIGLTQCMIITNNIGTQYNYEKGYQITVAADMYFNTSGRAQYDNADEANPSETDPVDPTLDQREYFLSGDGAGDIKASNWGKAASTTFTRVEGTNTYVLENFKLMANDQMKIRFNESAWNNGGTQYSFGSSVFPTDLFSNNSDGNAVLRAGKSGIYNITLITQGANTSTTGAADSQIVSLKFELIESLEIVTEDMGWYLTGSMNEWLQEPTEWKLEETSTGIYTCTFTTDVNVTMKAIHVQKVTAGSNVSYTILTWSNVDFEVSAGTWTITYTASSNSLSSKEVHVHSYNDGKFVDLGNGQHAPKCDNCDDVDNDKAADHVYDDGNCEAIDGTDTHALICDVCGNKDKTETHGYSYTDDNNGTTHTVTCTAGCGYSATQGHDYKSGDDGCICGAKEPVKTNYGTEDDPISVADALAIAEAECVSNNDVTAQVVYATGKVITVVDYSGSYITKFTLADLDEPSKTIIVYTMSKAEGQADPDQNDIIVLYGYIKNYNGEIEFASNNDTHVQLISTTRGMSTITLDNYDGADVKDLTDSAENGSEVSFTVTAKDGKKIDAVKVNGKEISGTDGQYTFEVHGNAIVTVATSDEGAAKLLEVTLKHNQTSTGNMTGGNDANTKFGVDASIFTITSEKTNSGSNHVGLNKDGSTRLYKNQTSTLHISVAEGYVIDKIEVVLKSDSQVKDISQLVVEVNGSEVAGTGVYNINAQKVSLWNKNNASSNNQIWIDYITVTYHAGEGVVNPDPDTDPKDPVDPNPSATKYFEKVTAELTDWSGTYLIVSEGKYAFNGSLAATVIGNTNSYFEGEFSSDVIDWTEALSDITFTIAKSGSGYTIQAASGAYLNYTAAGNGLTAASSGAVYSISYNASDKDVDITNSSSAHLRFNSSTGEMRFRFFKDSTYTSQKAIQLYKLVDNDAATTSTLSMSSF